MTEPIWKQLEILVAEIQRELAPDAQVTHDVKIKGRDSEQLRQVDVLIRQQVGQYELTIAIDCKDYAVPVDVKGVEEFQGLLSDIGVNKGAMVCPKGFTPAAKKVATRYQIDLFSPVDTDPHKWQVKPSVPMICDFRSSAIAFGISFSAPLPFRLPMNFWTEVQVYDENGSALGIPYELVLTRWNNGEYPHDPGTHENVQMFPVSQTFVDNGYGTRVPVTLYLSLKVTQRLYFGFLPIVKMRGLRDEHTGLVVTNAFTTGSLNAEEVENLWQRIESEDDAPVRPVMRLVGLDCYDITAS
jgi:Restriction endonuclease